MFVTPPYHCGVVEVAGAWPPLGFLYLGAQARLAGWDVEVYDAMTLRHDWERIAEHLAASSFDVLATSAITPTLPDAVEFCALAKRVRPGCTTMIGGVHPTFMAEEVLRDADGAIDYVLAGEGELALRTFLQNFAVPELRDAGPNLAYLRNGELVTGPRLPLVENLDELPVADDLLDWSVYTYYVKPGSVLASVATSRGCDHGCSFCSQQRFWNKVWRGRSPESVVAEMKRLKERYGVDVVLFTDEYPTQDRERWRKLLDLIIEADLDQWILMETRVEDILRDEELLPRYREAGIVHIYVGAEATDQETLDRIDKGITVDQNRAAIGLIAEHDMVSETSFILGFPEETAETIEQTFKQSQQFDPDFAHYLTITPWPYAELYEEVKEHIEEFDYRNYNLIEPVIKPTAMTRDQVDLAIIDCYRRFYMAKMMRFAREKSEFRRDYLLRSSKLIMKSSFLIGKLARLGMHPSMMMKDVMGKIPNMGG
jgi:anaerobic magnesium-protoporphyrin IX monomethyl ester cyclase